MLAHNLAYLCTSRTLHMLTLGQLARLYSATGLLGLKLYQQQHQALAAMVKDRLEEQPHAAPVSLTALLGAWVQLEMSAPAKLEPSPSQIQPSEECIQGYPGDEVMEAIVMHFHLHRHQMGSMALGQLLRALGRLRHAPPQNLVADMVEALRLQLRGLEDMRQVDAALVGLADLALDPGEAFAEACFQLALADGGADQRALSTVAWSLVKLKRCTPERWAALLARATFLTAPTAHSVDNDPSGPGGFDSHVAAGWLKAYCLLLKRYDVAVAPLPEDVHRQGLAFLLAEEQGPPHLKARLSHALAFQALRQSCNGRYEVEEMYTLKDPHTGAPLTLDLAVPELRFGLHVSRSWDFTRNRGSLAGNATILARMGRLAGWEVAVLPPPRILTGQPAPLPGELPQAIARLRAATRAFLLQRTKLPHLLRRGAPPPPILGPVKGNPEG